MLCTGNAARSVIAGAALAQRLPQVGIETAGTLTVDGQPMSWRTRAALEHVGVAVPTGHRSRQATRADLDDATLVIGLAPEHVAWVRREHPEASAKTATLRRLCRDLADTAGATLADVELESWEEVEDPGGGEADVFVACAVTVVGLVDTLAGELATLV